MHNKRYSFFSFILRIVYIHFSITFPHHKTKAPKSSAFANEVFVCQQKDSVGSKIFFASLT